MGVDPVSLAIDAALIAANMALTASQHFEGPRLTDLSVTTADYGAALNYGYGRRRFDGVSCIWAEPLREVKRQRKTKGGKFNDYTYYGTWAVAVLDQPSLAVTRIWFDRNLVYDVTGAGPVSPFADLGDVSQYMRVYLGAEDQDVDPRMAATIDAAFGAGSTPAYRGVTYIVFQDVPLEKIGNRLPQVSVEAATATTPAYPVETFVTGFESMVAGSGATFSADGTRLTWMRTASGVSHLEVWDVASRALMIATPLDTSVGAPPSFPGQLGIAANGDVYVVSTTEQLLRYPPDGVGVAVDCGTIPIDADYAMTLTDGAGVERVFITVGGATPPDGAQYVPGEVITLLDTAAGTGTAFRIGWYFKDAYGDIWALGQIVFDDLTCCLWRVVDTGARPGSLDHAFVTMPFSNGTSFGVGGFAYHAQGGGLDAFLVKWGDHLALIDIDTLTLSASNPTDSVSAAFLDAPTFAIIPPGAARFWVGTTEWDAASLTAIRTIDTTPYGYPGANSSSFLYDRVNHALIYTHVDDTHIAWLYLDRGAGAGVTLRAIVEDVAARCGLDVAADIDASDLTQTVEGYSWSQGTGKAILEPLLEAYDSEARPHDFTVEFRRRGAAVLGTIPVADMGAAAGGKGGEARYSLAAALDTDLPLKVNLTFADLANDQQPNTAIAQRPGAATDSRRELSLDASTLALTAAAARPMAEGYLRRGWIKAQTGSTALSRAWTKLEPGDAWTLQLDEVDWAAKLTRLEFGANGVLATEWERYSPRAHVASALAGAPADGLTPATLASFGYTKGLFLDVPLARDADDGLIGYLAAAPYSAAVAWPGAAFWRSDDGVAYDTGLGAVATTQAATMGYALSALPDALATVWDAASIVTVKLFDGELASDTKANVGAGTNRALLGDEIIGFTTATLMAADTYQLSGLIRGRRGTEWATGGHAAGERFVLLAGLPQAAMGASDVGDAFFVKPITNGGASGFPQAVTYTGASLKPYAPCHLAVAEVAGDLVATWTRRTRLGGTWRDNQDVPLGEGSEAYLGQVLNGAGAVIRSFAGLTAPTLTYTAAQQATDAGAGATLRVMQVSATVGAGFAADIAL